MRVDEAQDRERRHLAQPVWNPITACIFEWGIAMYDLDLGEHLRGKRTMSPEKKDDARRTLKNVGQQVVKDYVIWPALSLRGWRSRLAANVTANLARKLWSHSMIMCGHFPEGVEVFELDELDRGESRGDWYLRQMLGSATISGSKAMHLMSGNLSHQIEHHLFPDLPSNRYSEIAPQVRALFAKYGLTYCSRPLLPQVYSARPGDLLGLLGRRSTHRLRLVPVLVASASQAVEHPRPVRWRLVSGGSQVAAERLVLAGPAPRSLWIPP